MSEQFRNDQEIIPEKMENETVYQDMEFFDKAHLDIVADCAKKIYEKKEGKPLKILDLATGPNERTNYQIIQKLIAEGVNFDEYVLSDISPVHLKKGYELLVKHLPDAEAAKIKCVLADITDLRKEIKEVPLWGKGVENIKKVLNDQRYQFLQSGYDGTQRKISFENNYFDLVLGNMPYTSINEENSFGSAISESARVLRPDGYHIVDEYQVENINPCIERTLSAKERAGQKNIEEIKSLADKKLTPVKTLSITYMYRTDEKIPEQTLQDSDMVKRSVLVHTK